MWKMVLGIVGAVFGLPLGWLVGTLLFFVLADRYRINWFHGDDRLWWIILLFLVLGPVLGGGFGLRLGVAFDRTRARRHHGEISAEPAAAADRGGM